MKFRTRGILLAMLFCLSFGYAQRMGFNGDDMRTHPTRPGYYLLTGNAKVVSKGNTILSDKIDYQIATGSCEATGNLRITTKEKVKITGRLLIYDAQNQIFDIIDDVVLVDGTVTMKTQRLLYDAAKNIAIFNTPAEMMDGDTKLTSKRGQYFGKTRMFQCREDVVIENPEYTIWSDTMDYQSGFAQFYGPTRLKTEEYFMYCQFGNYDKKQEKVNLKKDAYIITKDQTLYGDSIHYNLAKKHGNVHQNVRIVDTIHNMFAWSDYAENDEKKGRAFLTKKARAALLEEQNTDTLYISADTMYVYYDTSRQVRRIQGFRQAKFYRKDVQGICDSLLYDAADSVLYMQRNPLAWVQEYQIKADTMRLWFRNQKPYQLLANDNLFMVSNPPDTDYYNQVKGRRMYGYFNEEGNLTSLDVQGNAESIYYVQDDKTKELIGINKSQSNYLRMYFDKKEIKGVNFIEPEKNALYPEEMLSEKEIVLKGFGWFIEKRPLSKFDISPHW